jgi:FMN phosphatase YigB (HAD superfamily)
MRFAVVDVDDVLIATAGALDIAADAMLVPLSQHFGRRQANAVRREFMLAMDVGIRHLRAHGDPPDSEYADLMRRTAWWQRGLSEAGFEVKAWSRHALIACALESCGLPVTAAAVDAAADRYWATVASRAYVYTDAALFVRRLRRAGVPIHLATGSDGFLTFDDLRQTFIYAPKRSARLKLARLPSLASLGFRADDITVADPVGKPSPGFYCEVLRRFAVAAGREIDLEHTVAVGDSLSNDILPLLGLGAARGVWLLRDGAAARRRGWNQPQVTIVGALDEPEVWDAFSA